MKRILRGVFRLVGAVLLVLIVLFSVSRLRGASAEQEHALTRLIEQQPLPGRNAFAAVWLLGFDVPESEQEAVAAADVRRFNAIPSSHDGVPTTFSSSAEGRFPDLVLDSDQLPKPCSGDEPACLARVRARRVDYRRWQAQHKRLFERTAALSAYGHYRSGFAPDFDAPFPSFMPTIHVRTSHAVDFVDGREELALANLCRDVVTWRRLVPNSDSLLTSMVGMAVVRSSSRLFAEMLAEIPPDRALPAECGVAFVPPTFADISICEPLKGEFRLISGALSSEMSKGGNAWTKLGYSLRMTEARLAAYAANACSERTEQAFMADRPLPSPAAQAMDFSCLGNFSGCVLADVSAPAYHHYQLRAQDYGAQLKLAGTLLWLREHAGDDRPISLRLKALPVSLRSPTREMELVDGGRMLRIAMFETKRHRHWQLPLQVLEVAPQPAM